MKILQINVLAKNRSTGRTTEELHSYLQSNGHFSYVAYGIGDKIEDKHYFKISNKFDYYLHNILARVFGNQGYYSYFSTKRLLKWINKITPDIIHLRNLHSNFINLPLLLKFTRKKNIPIVFTTHDFWMLTSYCPYPFENCNISECGKCLKYLHHPTIFYNPRKQFERKKSLLLNQTIGIQANSNFSLSVVNQSFLSECTKSVIYNWIDFNSFFPDIDNNFFKDYKKPVVLSIWSAFNESQNRFNFFAYIANQMNDKFDFVLVGNHNFDESKYPCIHFFQGTNDVSILRKYYSNALVLFDPSTTDTFGKVVAEALSCGTPAVVFNNQALPELIGDNECGIVIKPFDANESINAINTIFQIGKSHFTTQCLARSKALFSLETNCSKLVEFYNKVRNER